MLRQIITLLFLTMLTTGVLRAQSSVTAQAFAEVIEALTAQETQQLNFGRFSPETNGGQIVVTPDGTRSANGTVVLASGPHNPGLFTVTGAPLANFTIQLPPGPALLMHQGSSKTMIVDQWTSDPPATTETSTQSNGSQQVSVGATLIVGNMQDNPVGIYTGSFQLTFAYN
jgi:hypothetical protein